MNEKEMIAQVLKCRRILMDSCGQLNFSARLVDKIQPGVAVHIMRRQGKTNALLWTIYEREQGQAILVVLNGMHEKRMRDAWKVLVEKEEMFPIHDPKFIGAPSSPREIEGTLTPVYCDEWFQYFPEVRRALRESGRVMGAVGTDPAKGSDVEVLPL